MDIKQVTKRSGAIEKFDRGKIYNAIYLCFSAMGRTVKAEYIKTLTSSAVSSIKQKRPHVETVQSAIVEVLISVGELEVARGFHEFGN